ncbi:hypothetical protein ACJX0J_015669 [Zea mays]
MQSWLLFHALDRRAKQVVSRYMVPIQALRSLSAGSITGEWITNGKDIFFNAFNAYNLAIVYFFSFVEEICAIDDLKVLLFLLEFLGLPYRKQITSRNGISLCRSDLCASLAVTTILVQPIVDTGGGGIREQLCITFTRAIDRHIGSLVRLILFLRISFPLGDSIFSLQILLHLTNEILQMSPRMWAHLRGRRRIFPIEEETLYRKLINLWDKCLSLQVHGLQVYFLFGHFYADLYLFKNNKLVYFIYNIIYLLNISNFSFAIFLIYVYLNNLIFLNRIQEF